MILLYGILHLLLVKPRLLNSNISGRITVKHLMSKKCTFSASTYHSDRSADCTE